MTALVRPATPADTEALKRLMHAVIADSVEPAVRAGTIENVDANVGIWLERPADCVHLVAVQQGRIVGVVLVKDFWNLCSLFVATSCQGSGIGRALVEEALRLCSGRSLHDAVLLNAAPSAVAFYERLGFTARESRQALPPGIRPMQRPL